MRKLIACLCLMAQVNAFEKLPETYRIVFGNPEAKIKVTEYFSFLCPHCIALFRKEFPTLKASRLDTGDICFEFHPVPQDLATVQAMICFEKLSTIEKQMFVEVILESVDLDDPSLTPLLMKRAMEVFKKPMEGLQDEGFIEKTNAFQSAFEFIKQEDRIEAVPSVEINGKLYPSEIPELEFIENKIKLLNSEEK